MEKDFLFWHEIKSALHTRTPPTFKLREIWWCQLGVNVGREADGKGELFQRPVLVLRKFNSRSFIGVPLTSQAKDSPYYFRFHFHGRMQFAMLSQIRLLDALRLTRCMGQMRPEPFGALQHSLCAMLENTRPRTKGARPDCGGDAN